MRNTRKQFADLVTIYRYILGKISTMPWKETLGCFGFGMHLLPSFSDLFQIYCMNLSSWVWWRLLVPSWALPPDRAALNLASAACMGLGMFGGPQNRDHFDLAEAIGPVWDLLLAVGKILLLGKAALYGDGAGQPWVFGGVLPTAWGYLGSLLPAQDFLSD